MEAKVKLFEDPAGNVWKYVFEFEGAIAEAVLYKYNSFKERTVMCISVQSGCPVGCSFCGTGKKFIRNLTLDEIIYQAKYLISEVHYMEQVFAYQIEKFQIMFMSMGEPMLNWENVSKSIETLAIFAPNSQLLISTIGIKDYKVLADLLSLSNDYTQVGLQFSIHEAYDRERDFLIPFKNKLTLRQIRDYGIIWNRNTNRQVYLNYCISQSNSSTKELNRLMDLFPPEVFAFTFSVVCETEQGKCSNNDMNAIQRANNIFLREGYNVRVFDPAGKDTIGGGCGQLWYVQDYFKKHDK